ncbi:MAG: hotdog fold thioesterase [Gammaproteobacteria bacterium]|nr:hotdog fold thioesterase [Gammaproteobacteria bacterium]|tara:strand:- start:1060 stop:1509 length:450 start_codon:yes stop_codon:yes gene_type:complete
MTQIWHQKNIDHLEAMNTVHEGTLMETLGIVITEIGDDYVKGTMPVDERTKQPYGILHGGASLGLAETLASTGAGLCIDNSKYKIVGQEINANHLRSATEGLVTGIASPVFVGQRTQVWEVKIYKSETDFNDKNLCCISRMTALRIDRG